MAHHCHFTRHDINVGDSVRIFCSPQSPQRQGRAAILTARHVSVDPLKSIGLDHRPFSAQSQRLLARERSDRRSLLIQPLYSVICLHTHYELASKALLNHDLVGRYQSGLQLRQVQLSRWATPLELVAAHIIDINECEIQAAQGPEQQLTRRHQRDKTMPLPQPALPSQRMIVSYLSHCLFH